MNDNRDKLSYVHGASEVPLLGDTIGRAMDRAAALWGDCEALVSVHQNIRWTYRELAQKVDEYAAAFLALGLEPGERIGIWSHNNAEWIR